MAAIKQLKVPQSAAELLMDTQRVADAYTILNLLLAGQIEIVTPTSTKGRQSLIVSGENIVFPIPLKFTRPISDSTVNLTSVSTQLNLLLAEHRKTGQNPGS